MISLLQQLKDLLFVKLDFIGESKPPLHECNRVHQSTGLNESFQNMVPLFLSNLHDLFAHFHSVLIFDQSSFHGHLREHSIPEHLEQIYFIVPSCDNIEHSHLNSVRLMVEKQALFGDFFILHFLVQDSHEK